MLRGDSIEGSTRAAQMSWPSGPTGPEALILAGSTPARSARVTYQSEMKKSLLDVVPTIERGRRGKVVGVMNDGVEGAQE